MAENSLLLEVRGVSWTVFLRRTSRFTVEVEEPSGARKRCHLHDPGRLRHLLAPGARLLVKPAWKPGRSTSCDVVAVEAPEKVLVLEDTRLPNRLWPRAADLVMPGVWGWQPERMVNGTRIDYVGYTGEGLVLVELKATNLAEKGEALFPDAPSRRAVRQVEALIAAKRGGGVARAAVVFTILRPDAERLRPNRRIDSQLAARLAQAERLGVELLAYRVNPVYTPPSLRVYYAGTIPVEV